MNGKRAGTASNASGNASGKTAGPPPTPKPSGLQVHVGTSSQELAARVARLSQLAAAIAASSGKGKGPNAPKGAAKGNQSALPGSSGAGTTGGKGNGSGGTSSTSAPVAKSANPAVQRKQVLAQRVYLDSQGKEVAKARMATAADFNKRVSAVNHKDFVSGAVGLAESSVYHGTESLEMDFVRNGVRGTRAAGHQLLRTVTVPTFVGAGPLEGARLLTKLLSPAALGGRLAWLAQAYEQCRVNHCYLVYKPVVAATVTGAIAMAFENDLSQPSTNTGTSVLTQASQNSAFVDTQVWNPAGLRIDPSAMNVKYTTDAAGDPQYTAQGKITILAASALAAGTYGHLYLEWDYEFFSPRMDLTISDDSSVAFILSWGLTGAVGVPVVRGEPVSMLCAPAAGGLATASAFVPVPADGARLFYGEVVDRIAGTASPTFETAVSPVAMNFNVGQTFYFRFAGETDVFTDGTMNLLVYADYESALQMVSADPYAHADGQLVYALTGTAGGATAEKVTMRCEQIQLDLTYG